MKLFLCAALVACLVAVDACQSATVRGTQGRSLTATAPVSMTIRQGDSATLSIDIDRERFVGAVTVSIFHLPKGVEPDKSSINAQTTTATFILKAGKAADLVTRQAVGVTVEDPDGRKATQFVELTVTD